MQKITIFGLALLLSFSMLFAYDGKKKNKICFDKGIITENVSIDMDDGTLILTSKEDKHLVMEITEEYDLYLNGEEVELNSSQRRLVKRYYHQWIDIVDQAKLIGVKGAKLGVEGAKLGMKAVVNLFKMMRDDYDSEDYEAEIEAEAEKIEAKAEKIELEADEIEELVEEFEEIQAEMEKEIEEIAESGIFDTYK